MTNDQQKILIGVLAGALGMALLMIAYIFLGGGPDRGAPSAASASTSTAGRTAPTPAPTATPEPTPPPPPVFEWKPAATKKFDLQPGGGVSMGPFVAENGEDGYPKIRYDIEGSQGVNTGLMDVTWAANPKAAWANFNPPFSVCYDATVLSSQKTCPMPANSRSFIFIRDTRTTGQVVSAAIGAWLGAKKPLESATTENRVTVTIYKWQCVQNCNP